MIEWLFIGAIAGAAFMAACWVIDRKSCDAYLRLKAEPHTRTPVKIEGEFFYIVPEREYVEIRLRAMRRSYQEDYDVVPRPKPTYGNGIEKAPRD
jgi:hypothetical protein